MKTFNEHLIFYNKLNIYYFLVKLNKNRFFEFIDRTTYYVSDNTHFAIRPKTNYYYFEFKFKIDGYGSNCIEVNDFFSEALPFNPDFDLNKVYSIETRDDFGEYESILNHASKMQLNKLYKNINKLLLLD